MRSRGYSSTTHNVVQMPQPLTTYSLPNICCSLAVDGTIEPTTEVPVLRKSRDQPLISEPLASQPLPPALAEPFAERPSKRHRRWRSRLTRPTRPASPLLGPAACSYPVGSASSVSVTTSDVPPPGGLSILIVRRAPRRDLASRRVPSPDRDPLRRCRRRGSTAPGCRCALRAKPPCATPGHASLRWPGPPTRQNTPRPRSAPGGACPS